VPANGALSYSAVRTYTECPLRYKFLYIDKLPETPRGYFSFGRTVHSVLEELLKPLVVPAARRMPDGERQRTLDEFPPGSRGPATSGRLPTVETMLAWYEERWVGDGYTSAEEETRYRALGRDLLRAYWERIAATPPAPVAVEQHLEATWEGVAVHGYLDRIDRTAGGGLEIIDYKTSRELSQNDVRESDQLTVYQVLVESNYSEPVERLTLYHLRGQTALSAPRRVPEAVGVVRERVGRTYDGIRSSSYEPTPGRHCSRCEFKGMCPEFRNVPEPDRERLGELVDRFERLRGEERRLERDLRAAAEALHQEAERLGVRRIPGKDAVAVRRREETWRFREESVGPLLSANGLAGRVRPDDPEGLRRLVLDRSVDADVRRKLSETGGRQVRWYWELEDGDRGAGT
jgi:putative RecB family exonuclease